VSVEVLAPCRSIAAWVCLSFTRLCPPDASRRVPTTRFPLAYSLLKVPRQKNRSGISRRPISQLNMTTLITM